MTSPEAQNAPDEPELFKYVRIAKERNLVYNGRHLPYLRKLGKYAHQLRSNLTPCEKRIMGFLRSRGMNFRMQHPIIYLQTHLELNMHFLERRQLHFYTMVSKDIPAETL